MKKNYYFFGGNTHRKIGLQSNYLPGERFSVTDRKCPQTTVRWWPGSTRSRWGSLLHSPHP